MRRDSKGRLPAYIRIVALMLVVHLALGLLLANLPQLHKFVHHDCDSPTHVCFVTILANGLCDAPSLPVVISPVVRVALPCEAVPKPLFVESVYLVDGLLARAPPALLS